MTESSFPFGDPAAEAAAAETANRGRVVALLAAGFLVVAALGYFVLWPMFAGDDDEDFTVAPSPRRTATARPSGTAPPTTQAIPPVRSDIIGRDPFKPLYVAPAPAPAGTVAPGGPGGPVAPGGPGSTAAPGPGSGPGTQPGSSTTRGGTRVALINVFSRDGKRYAETKVGDRTYTVAVGGTFANNYRLLSVQGNCASYLFGDEQFSLCEGQEVLK